MSCLLCSTYVLIKNIHQKIVDLEIPNLEFQSTNSKKMLILDIISRMMMDSDNIINVHVRDTKHINYLTTCLHCYALHIIILLSKVLSASHERGDSVMALVGLLVGSLYRWGRPGRRD